MDFNFLDQPNQHLPLQIPYGMPPSTSSQASTYHEMPLESPTVDLVYPVTISSTGAEYPPRPIALPQALPPDRPAVFSTRIDLVNAGNLQVTQSSNSGLSQQVPQRGHSFHIPAFATTTHPDLNLTNTIRTATQCNSATGHRAEVPNIAVLSKPGPRPERDVHPNNCPPRSEREVDNNSSLQNKGQVQSTGPTVSSCNKTAVKRLAPSGQSGDDASKDHAGDSQPYLHNNALATSILIEGGVLPEGLAYKQFDNDIKCVGVIAEKIIKKGTRYGPFKGDIKKGDFSENGHSNRQTWE
ncbi:uncharacterized protein, partial [Diadema antillarum]|uniref:uncharacterized protein n=1 Tax=Diadema antillarum TaxID=105358 RepID=UPI003A87275C